MSLRRPRSATTLVRLAFALGALISIAAQDPNPPITVGTTTITNEYPESIRFQVRVASEVADIESVELLIRLRGDSTTLSVPAEFVPTRRPIVWAVWETREGGVPPGAEVSYQWRVRDAAGNAFTTETLGFVVEDSRFDWQMLESDDLALWWYDGSKAFGQEVFVVAEQALAGMRRSQAVDLTDRLHIVLYADDEAFAGWHDYVLDWVAGEAYPGMGLTVQVVPPSSTSAWIEDVIPHEVAHLFFYRATYTPLAFGPPSWLDEGFAGYHEFGSKRDELRWVRELAAEGDLIPLRLATGSFGIDDHRVSRLYAESLSAVTFLYETWGEGGVADLLRSFRSGSDTDEALLEVTGMDFEQFQREWWDWLGGAPGMYPTPPSPGASPSPPTPTPEATAVSGARRRLPDPSFFCCPMIGWTLASVVLVSSRSRFRRNQRGDL